MIQDLGSTRINLFRVVWVGYSWCLFKWTLFAESLCVVSERAQCNRPRSSPASAATCIAELTRQSAGLFWLRFFFFG
jgi:hypothetical protein